MNRRESLSWVSTRLRVRPLVSAWMVSILCGGAVSPAAGGSRGRGVSIPTRSRASNRPCPHGQILRPQFSAELFFLWLIVSIVDVCCWPVEIRRARPATAARSIQWGRGLFLAGNRALKPWPWRTHFREIRIYFFYRPKHLSAWATRKSRRDIQGGGGR